MRLLVTGARWGKGLNFVVDAESAGHLVVHLRSDVAVRQALFDEIAITNPDDVVPVAGISFVGHKDDSAFYAVNVVGTTNLLASLVPVRKSVQKVLLASSSNVYGNCDASPIGEQQPAAQINH